MANWCSVVAYIRGEEKNIRSLYKELDELFKKQEKGEIEGFADMATHFSITEDVYTRGYLRYVDMNDDDDSTIEISFESAWNPCVKIWTRIAKKYDCKYFYMAEEPGAGIYESNDIEHDYFWDEFYVDAYRINDTKYASLFDEGVDIYSKVGLQETLAGVLGDIPLEEQIQIVEKERESFKDGWLSINEVEYISTEEAEARNN